MKIRPDNEFQNSVIEFCFFIPRGKIISYGMLATAVGYPAHSRHVAAALRSYTGTRKLPWHRVVSSKGILSISEASLRQLQQILLEKEGIIFAKDTGKICDFKKKIWFPQS